MYAFGTMYYINIIAPNHMFDDVLENPVHDNHDYFGKHQVEHACNNSLSNSLSSSLVTYFTGGLNAQIEHHLFTKIYPFHDSLLEISKIVKKYCKIYNVKYRQVDSLWLARKMHYNYLQKLGKNKMT